MTAEELIKAAYRWIGKKNPRATPDVSNGLEALNMRISNLSAENVFIPFATTENFSLVIGTGSYSIGVSQDFNTVVPMFIKYAYARSSSGVDTPVRIITDEEYNRISIKTTSGTPNRLFYVYGAAFGTIYIYPVLSVAYDLYLESYKPLTRYAAKTDVLGIPDEYQLPLKFLLGLDLTGELNVVDAVRFAQIKSIAKEAKENIETLNMARVGIAPQRFPELSGLFRSRPFI